MCCLKNEQETYEYLNSRMPNVGDIVVSKEGISGEVKSLNVLRQYVKVLVENGDEKEIREFSVDDIKFTPSRKKDVKLTAEELKELEGLEDSDEIVEEKPKAKNRNPQNKNNPNRNNSNRQKESESNQNNNVNGDGNRESNRDKKFDGNRNHHNKNRRNRNRGKRNDNGNNSRQQSDTQ